jgi:DNA helicase II / ATP-dependent DNA helicase PcrA
METLLTKMPQKDSLNPDQTEAVRHLEGPLLVLAGAGSGKTRVVTRRIVHLLENGVAPHQILGLTFTNKAAGEMTERVRQATSANVLISTFHSLGARILRESIHNLGYSQSFAIYDEEDSGKLLRSCLEQIDFPDRKKAVKAFRNLISRAKNAMEGPLDLDPNEFQTTTLKKFPEAYALYQARLKESNAVDFDDLLFLPVKLFRDNPEILKVYQSRWKYLLVDEYQDTNHAQYDLIKLLAGERQNLFVVGDPDQSIYSWRGATIRNILSFEKDFPGAKIIRLEQNYRSRENILEAANALIAKNEDRYEKDLWSERGIGEKIQVLKAQSETEEAEFVCDEIRRHQLSGNSLDEIVVFYRTNFQSRVFEDAFLHQNIPYVIVGGISFYQRLEVKDILAFLRMVQTGTDFVAFMRTINIPKRGIGPATIDKLRLAAVGENLPIFDYCRALVGEEPLQEKVRLNKKQKEGLAAYIKIIEELRSCAQSGSIRDLVIDTIEATKYESVIREDPETYDDRRQNILELASTAAEWEQKVKDPNLTDFLSELTLKSSLDQQDLTQERVKLMTLHNGKGLEFDIVFLVGLEEDLFPHINSKDSQEKIEEERRLCYVGMTRAKEQLYMTRAKFRYMWGMLRQMHPSRFLFEIPPKFLKDIDRGA